MVSDGWESGGGVGGGWPKGEIKTILSFWSGYMDGC